MSATDVSLQGFAYGEHLEGVPERSLGYRLLTPVEPQPWCSEVEALARRLQAAPYPDHWPPTDLFCSVLLDDGRRLIAVARYGLADHTPSRRRGGLELIGVIGPAEMEVSTALAVYHWLRQRRAQTDNLHSLGGQVALAEVLAAVPPWEPSSDPVPVLPVRLWQGGALLFAATTPSEPDHRLSLLEQGAGRGWQWLPLVGADFPLPSYAQRGPLVAWTAHLAGVALKLDRKPTAEPAPPVFRLRWPVYAAAAAALLLLSLLAANLWAYLALHRRLAESAIAGSTSAPEAPPRPEPDPRESAPASANGPAREQFASALYNALVEQSGSREWEQGQDRLITQYERLARQNPDLRLDETNTRGKIAVGALSVLSQRSAARVEGIVRKALEKKGFDPELVQLACDRVREQLVSEGEP